MTFEITETAFKQTDKDTVYRYECFIDNVLIAFSTWREKREPYNVFQHFIKGVLREWKTEYKNKYNMKKITKQDMERFNPKTIVKEDIEDIDLILKKANNFDRLQKLQEDFQ